MVQNLVYNKRFFEDPKKVKLLLSDLIEILLNAVIKNGESGIHNGIMDLNPRYVEDQYSLVEDGLALLVEFKSDDSTDFDYIKLGELLTDSAGEGDVEKAIYRMIDFYEATTKTECEIYKEEIKLLVGVINNEINDEKLKDIFGDMYVSND